MEELMHQCGFQNRGTFYRAFNAKVGMTPKEFRKRVVSERDIM
jgi:AraC-like DNA-binding protein